MKMNREEFLKEFCNILQVESIDINEKLSDIPEWDSLSMIAIMAFLDKKFNLKVSIKDIQDFETFNNIIKFLKI